MFSIRPVRALLLALVVLAIPAASFAQISVSIVIAPPVLPVYAQPICPAAGYIWAPGYWAYGPDGYYWVPGTWVLAPAPGLLWTPGYWAWSNGFYLWNAGYWGPHVGFYGGVNYGFGYVGVGYLGGYWNNGAFYYNRTVNNVNVTNIQNTYNKTVINNVTVNQVSYNGGSGGTAAKPTPQEETAAREKHIPATTEQTHHEHAASTNRALLASENHGRPAVAATAKPGQFTGAGVIAARAATAPKVAPRNAAVKNTGQTPPPKANKEAEGEHRKPPPPKKPETAKEKEKEKEREREGEEHHKPGERPPL